jgi:purine-binding chemotaxis protein CheW
VAESGRIDFLSGLVTLDTGMIALIDLSCLLAMSLGDGAQSAIAAVSSAA